MEMRPAFFTLNPPLSRLSWRAIEFFTAVGIFFLPFSDSAFQTSLIVAVVIWAARKFPWGERLSPGTLLHISYAVLLVAAALSVSAVPVELRGTALRGIFKWTLFVLLFFMARELFGDRAAARRLLGVFIVSAALAAANGYYQLIVGVDLVKGFVADVPGRFIRMRGSFPSPNDLAAYLMLALPLAFECWAAEKRWNRRSVLWVLLLALFAGAFVGTLSRGAILALIGGIVLWAALARRPAVITAAALSCLPLLLSPLFRQNFVWSLVRHSDITVGERLSYWQTAIRMIQLHPFLGNGVNLFTALFTSFAPEGQTYRGYAHNCYLQLWAETGIAGLTAFLVPVAAAVAREVKTRGAGGALFCGTAALLLQSVVDTNLYGFQTAHAFWLAWGALFAVSRAEQP